MLVALAIMVIVAIAFIMVYRPPQWTKKFGIENRGGMAKAKRISTADWYIRRQNGVTYCKSISIRTLNPRPSNLYLRITNDQNQQLNINPRHNGDCNPGDDCDMKILDDSSMVTILFYAQ